MSKITFKNIQTLASKTKKYVEENGKLPKTLTVDKVEYTYPQIGHILAKSVCNIGKDVTVIKVKVAPDPTGETVKLKLTKEEYLKEAKNYYKFIEDENKKRLPNYSKIKNKKVKQRVMIYSLSKIIVWYTNNKELPDSCKFYTSETVKKTTTNTSTKKTTTTNASTKKTTTNTSCTNPYTSQPHYTSTGCNKLGQCTSYYCAPHSIHQALKKFGITNISESTLARWAGTTSSGTDHDGINTAIAMTSKKSGVKLSVKWYYMSDFGSTTAEQFKTIGKIMCQKNKAVFYHIGYQCSGSCSNGTVFGHYEMLQKINTSNKTVIALNSLGNKCGSTSYCGHIQNRSFDLQKHYINNKTSVKSVCIITKG